MFNVLTKSSQQDAVREYRLRIAAAACLVVTLEVLATALGGAFSFQALRDEVALWRNGGEAERASPAEHSNAGELIERTNARLALLTVPPPAPLAPGVVALLSARVFGVRFVSFSAEAASDGGWTLIAQGVAATRSALAEFERALALRHEFSDIEIPVESFAKEAHAPFTLRALYSAPNL